VDRRDDADGEQQFEQPLVRSSEDKCENEQNDARDDADDTDARRRVGVGIGLAAVDRENGLLAGHRDGRNPSARTVHDPSADHPSTVPSGVLFNLPAIIAIAVSSPPLPGR
jgi:hypothetical protein